MSVTPVRTWSTLRAGRSRWAPPSSIFTPSTAPAASSCGGSTPAPQLDDVTELNQALGFTGNQSVGEQLEGGYLEAGYDVLPDNGRSSLIPYLRWEQLNTQVEVPDGWSANPANDQTLVTLGVAYQPIPQLIFKAEYLNVDNQAGTGVDQFNLASGIHLLRWL